MTSNCGKSSRLINRNITSLSGRTSMRLEPELWEALHEICHRECLSLGALIRRIEDAYFKTSHHPGGRTSAVRVHVLRYFRDAVTEEGHRRIGHGALQDTVARVEEGWAQSRTEVASAS